MAFIRGVVSTWAIVIMAVFFIAMAAASPVFPGHARPTPLSAVSTRRLEEDRKGKRTMVARTFRFPFSPFHSPKTTTEFRVTSTPRTTRTACVWQIPTGTKKTELEHPRSHATPLLEVSSWRPSEHREGNSSLTERQLPMDNLPHVHTTAELHPTSRSDPTVPLCVNDVEQHQRRGDGEQVKPRRRHRNTSKLTHKYPHHPTRGPPPGIVWVNLTDGSLYPKPKPTRSYANILTQLIPAMSTKTARTYQSEVADGMGWGWGCAMFIICVHHHKAVKTGGPATITAEATPEPTAEKAVVSGPEIPGAATTLESVTTKMIQVEVVVNSATITTMVYDVAAEIHSPGDDPVEPSKPE